ncbi:tRNA-modifying protein YgfZ [Vibrio sp. TH_r3]|uniref:tRNA-modifying protein YgfZ n=1 Tax=Vibrio sp. TH_r3 TaxID=3082084 RepID=UPI00295554BE|nr:tRNA-modifying protein YgfZ [Vibrio sp. TH_r3]MDV7106269.1 tRNA-modifying protein YgfZ [Vibrio sp. TH_r3]
MEWQNRFTKLELNSNDTLPDLIISHLHSWKSISVAGEDQLSYLQGQLTCDVVSLGKERSSLGAHCDAKGKVLSIFRCFHHRNDIALIQHASIIESSLKEIKKYSVFSKVDISISQELVLAVIGNKAEQTINSLTSDSGDVRTIPGGTVVKVDQQRWLVLINQDSLAALLDSLNDAVFADQDIWDKLDIESATPRIVESVQNSQIPQAFNLQAIGGISFTKGCYTGQETVARAKYRGTNKRYMAIVKGVLDKVPDGNIELERSVGENWRGLGSLFVHYHYADGVTIGLIILPNNLEPDTQLRAVNQPNSQWQIEALPYNLED